MSLRWNLTQALTAKERLREADLTAAQAHLGYQDLRAKLTLGVTEAREAIRQRKLVDATEDWLRQLRDRAYVENRLDQN